MCFKGFEWVGRALQDEYARVVCVKASHLYGCWCDSAWLALLLGGHLSLEQHQRLASTPFWVFRTPVQSKRCRTWRCPSKRGWERFVLSKLLSRFGEHHCFFSHQPRCAAYFLLLFAPAWITPAYCLVYITYFFVSVCKCVTCIYNVLSLPVYYDTTVACDTLALGVYRLFLTRYRLCSGSGSMLSQLYTHYLVAPLVKSTAFCELSVLIMFRVFLSPRGLQTKCNKKYRPMLTGSLASAGQLLLDGVLMHIASVFFKVNVGWMRGCFATFQFEEP